MNETRSMFIQLIKYCSSVIVNVYLETIIISVGGISIELRFFHHFVLDLCNSFAAHNLSCVFIRTACSSLLQENIILSEQTNFILILTL